MRRMCDGTLRERCHPQIQGQRRTGTVRPKNPRLTKRNPRNLPKFMKIFFYCPNCQQSLSAPSILSFFKISCPKCSARITVPQDSINSHTIEISAPDVLDINGKSRETRTFINFDKPKFVSQIPSLQGGSSYDQYDGCSDRASDREIP